MDYGEAVLRVAAIGVGATVVMDLWALAQKRLFGIPSLDHLSFGIGLYFAGLATTIIAPL